METKNYFGMFLEGIKTRLSCPQPETVAEINAAIEQGVAAKQAKLAQKVANARTVERTGASSLQGIGR